MTRRTEPLSAVLASSLDLPRFAAGAEVPEWVHLVPTLQGQIETHDGRGPYRIENAAEVISASMALERGLVVDETHETDKGNPAPARGWIAELQARDDGIWGRVEWTGAGRDLIADRAYRGISPNLLVDAQNVVRAIARAALTNKPNLRGLTPVLQEELPMNMAKIAEALGLGADATEDAILAAIGKMKGKADKPSEAMQSALTELGSTLSVEGADPMAIVAAGKAAKANADLVPALQAEVSTLKGQLAAQGDVAKRAASTAFVDGEIAKKRAIPAKDRDWFITLHMSDPATAERAIGAMSILGETRAQKTPPTNEGGLKSELSAEQSLAAKLLGITPADYLKTLNAEKETA
jgi:phage I-like protein